MFTILHIVQSSYVLDSTKMIVLGMKKTEHHSEIGSAKMTLEQLYNEAEEISKIGDEIEAELDRLEAEILKQYECPNCEYKGKAKFDEQWGDVCPKCDEQLWDSDEIQ